MKNRLKSFRLGKSVSLAALLALTLVVAVGSPAAASFEACIQACENLMGNDLNACEIYLVPDGNGGWIRSSQYDSCVLFAHVQYEMCEHLCIVDHVY